jgi:transcriptional regulator with XRE-family HTH domain
MPKPIESPIRTARVALGLSREALAQRLGVSVTWLGIVERGPVFASPALLARIATTLGLDPATLSTGTCSVARDAR